MRSPLVSICIPTYNRPQFLQSALDSCFRQTYKNYEIIITDNSDNFETQRIVKNIRNKKIKYFKNKKFLNSFENIQKNLKLAQGAYVKMLFDDDLLKPDCLNKMVTSFQKNPSTVVVMAPLDIIDEQGKQTTPIFYLIRRMKYLYKYLDHSTLVKKETIMKDFLTRVYPCCVPTGFMIKKTALDKTGGFSKPFSFVGDLELCMHLAKYGDFYYINEFLSSWRYSSSSETIAILHKKGIQSNIFYELGKKYCPNTSLKQDAYLFASKRTLLNALAGIKSGNLGLIWETIKTINKEDIYLQNKIKLPFIILYEIVKSIAIR